MSDKPEGVIYVNEEELDELSIRGEVLLRGRKIKDDRFLSSEGGIAMVACKLIGCINCGEHEHCEYKYYEISYVVVENIQLIRGLGNIKVRKFLT